MKQRAFRQNTTGYVPLKKARPRQRKHAAMSMNYTMQINCISPLFSSGGSMDLPGEICCFLRFFGAGRERYIAANERSGMSSFIFSLSRRSGVRR